MNSIILSFLAGGAAAVAAFSGIAFAVFREECIKRVSHYLVSFAVGALLGVVFFDILPEAFEMAAPESVLPFVLFGIIFFFTLERLLFWYHCHEGSCPVHTVSYLVLWGDFLHNFVDGIVIALSFLVDSYLGVLTAAAVLLHEIPQEIGDFSVLIHAGMARGRALVLNFFVATSVLLGIGLHISLGPFLYPISHTSLA